MIAPLAIMALGALMLLAGIARSRRIDLDRQDAAWREAIEQRQP